MRQGEACGRTNPRALTRREGQGDKLRCLELRRLHFDPRGRDLLLGADDFTAGCGPQRGHLKSVLPDLVLATALWPHLAGHRAEK
ncbi:MAG: hypothetical protein HOK97_21495 [Deltaproteobacteria bacterium]|nr:hypothetical protein [Deltaproteobacteria bacterium]MBT6492359.1 hypothetical protein [Deltaproteobacteria bacterium]